MGLTKTAIFTVKNYIERKNQMSLVVAIKKDGAVYMGADTRTSKGDRIYTLLGENDLKIRRLGSCLVGGVGSVSCIQLLDTLPHLFELDGKPLTKRFIVENVIPEYYGLAKRLERLNSPERETDEPTCSASFLVTDGDGLFMITDSFEVIELSRCGEIGCTKQMARSVILASLDLPDPNETILNALRISSYRNDAVGAPYVLINTRDNRFEIIEK